MPGEDGGALKEDNFHSPVPFQREAWAFRRLSHLDKGRTHRQAQPLQVPGIPTAALGAAHPQKAGGSPAFPGKQVLTNPSGGAG